MFLRNSSFQRLFGQLFSSSGTCGPCTGLGIDPQGPRGPMEGGQRNNMISLRF